MHATASAAVGDLVRAEQAPPPALAVVALDLGPRTAAGQDPLRAEVEISPPCAFVAGVQAASSLGPAKRPPIRVPPFAYCTPTILAAIHPRPA
jgi:hypothetical protein